MQRYNDPFYSCLGIVCSLKSQVYFYEEKLNFVNKRISIFHEREQHKQEKDSMFFAVRPLEHEYDASNGMPSIKYLSNNRKPREPR